MIELPAIELGNLLRPLFLARMLSGLAAALLCTYGARIALQVLRLYRVGRSSEGQLLLERRAELAATVVEVALGIGVIAQCVRDLLQKDDDADAAQHAVNDC